MLVKGCNKDASFIRISDILTHFSILRITANTYHFFVLKFLINVADDVTFLWKLSGAVVSQRGNKFLKIKEFQIVPTIGKMTMNAENLFKDNPALCKFKISLKNRNFVRDLTPELLFGSKKKILK